jgi:hypothetical protein
VRGIDRTIMFHLRHSPALREFLRENFDRFPFTGLTLLCFEYATREEVEAELLRLIGAPGVDAPETERRRALLEMFRNTEDGTPMEYTARSMEQRR